MRAPKRLTAEDGGGQYSVHNPSIYLPLLLPTASSKTCLTSLKPHAQSHGSKKQIRDSFILEKREEVGRD